MAKKIMAWSKCKIEIGQTGTNDAMAASLTSIGVISNQSSTLSAEAGDALQAIATGGEIVAEEPQEGTLTLETTVIEPDNSLLVLLGLTKETASADDVSVKTHVVEGNWSVKVTPKNNGAMGIEAPKCTIAYAPAWDEENGNTAVLTFTILKTTEVPETPASGDDPAVDNNYWYKRFKTTSSL